MVTLEPNAIVGAIVKLCTHLKIVISNAVCGKEARCSALLKSRNDFVDHFGGRHVVWKVIPVLAHERMEHIVVIDDAIKSVAVVVSNIGKIDGVRVGRHFIVLWKHAVSSHHIV